MGQIKVKKNVGGIENLCVIGIASAEGYTIEDGTALNLSDKNEKCLGLKDIFKF